AGPRLPGVVNAYLGRDRRRWRSGVSTYGSVRYPDVVPGVDLSFRGTGGRLEYDLSFARPVAVRRLRLGFGGGRPTLDARGGLVSGAIHQPRPVAWQVVRGRRVRVPVRWRVRGRAAGFALGRHARRGP